MKDEIDWLHRFLNCTPFGPPPSEIQRAHEIVDKLMQSARSEEGERIEHLQRQIGYIATELMAKGDPRTLPEIVETAATNTI